MRLYAGLVMGADWLGSSLPLLGPDWRPEAVAEVLRTLPWTDGYSPRPATAGLPGPPLGAQTVITAIPVTERLVIVEAPTGAGRTETAVLRALQLIAAGAVTGFYCAVPTRSAATELHDRVARLVVTHSPAPAGKVVRAVAGQLDTDPWQQPATPTWAIAGPKRAMFAPAIVGTIDQAMLSTLRTTHAWLRHVALSRQLLIIDEAHASDPYMTEVIRTLVRRQLDLGGHALLMSATLGESLRAELEGRPRMGFAAARAAPYPAVNGLAVAVTLSIRTAAAALAQVIACVRAGGCPLVIRATVTAAIETYTEPRAIGIPTLPHHSRYVDVDR